MVQSLKTPSRWSARIKLSVTTRGEAPRSAVRRTGGEKSAEGRRERMPKTESRGLLIRRPLWILACYQNNRMRMLSVDADGDGGYLPVFSFEEEAQTFFGSPGRCREEENEVEHQADVPRRTDLGTPGAMRASEVGGTRHAAVVNLRRPGNAPLDEGKARTLREVPDGGAQRAVRRGSSGLQRLARGLIGVRDSEHETVLEGPEA